MGKNGRKSIGCPVCGGKEMDKLEPSAELELTLDYCNDCGGMWFESGEVRQLHLLSPEVLGGLITMKKQLFTVDCPECSKPMTRNAAECSDCGHDNTINCPTCSLELERIQSELFTVDVCRDCRGVWFDNMDLSQVWNLQFDESALEKGSTADDTVLAILRHSEDQNPVDGDRNAFATIAEIVGGIFTQEA